MRGLDIRKYIAVPFEEKAILPWIADETSADRIQSNSAYLHNLQKAFSQGPSESFLRTILFHQIDDNSLPTLDECTKILGIVSSPVKSGGFLSPEEHNSMLSTTPVALLSERFYGRPYINLGSSRHALLKDVQLKGVGLNLMGICEDYHHRWGGFIVRDALKSFLCDIVVNKRSKLGTLKSFAAFVYEDEQLGNLPMCIQMRDATTFRLAQVHPDFLTIQDIAAVKASLETFFLTSDPCEMMKKILDHYVHSFSVGIHYRSITFDNLTIDGRFIDCESIDFTLDKRPVPRFITISVPTQIAEDDLLNLNLGEALSSFAEIYFMDSPAHYLYKLGKLTLLIYESIWENFSFDVKKTILVQSEQYLGSHLQKEDWSLLEKYESSSIVTLMGKPHDRLTPVIPKDFQAFAHFNYNHHFYDPLSDTTVISYSENMKTDLRFECNQILKKWELAFWPHQKKCTWTQAFENYKKMSDYIE